MGRRSKEELLQANYYEWLKVREELLTRKKNGQKLTSAEKLLCTTVPTPDRPYIPVAQKKGASHAQTVPDVKKASPKPVAKITFSKDVVWPMKGNAFLCEVYNAPYTDEQCILFCEREDCPFHGKGYMRTKGIKF